MASFGGTEEPEESGSSFLSKVTKPITIRYQSLLDKSTPHPIPRWLFCLFIFIAYCVRVYLLQGFYIVTYALGIYLLNLLIGFLTPVEVNRPDNDEPTLPTRINEEFKPFMRRLPEFKFWLSVCKALLFAICCTFFSVFDIPVFWPILVMYFILLFSITMKRQIKHMIKYRYLPFDYGKPKHKGKEETGKIVPS